MSETPNVWKSPAIAMIAAERARQIGELGYSLEHDAGHDDGELARAAAWYALTPRLRAGWSEPTRRGVVVINLGEIIKPDGWVLRGNTDRIRELTKAGALIVAEIERLALATPWVDVTLTHDDTGRPLVPPSLGRQAPSTPEEE